MTEIVLATEDELSEAIGVRLLDESGLLANRSVQKFRNRGYGYLRKNMSKWIELSRQRIVFLITDLDRNTCPIALINDWLGTTKFSPTSNMLFRVAVHETESWVLADHVGIQQLLGKKCKLPPETDSLPDPKKVLLSFAKKAPRAIKNDLVVSNGAIAGQGIGYNRRLTSWVNSTWNPNRAAERSQSLSRTRIALANLTKRISSMEQGATS